MKHLNRVTLAGIVAQPPNMQETGLGVKVAHLAVLTGKQRHAVTAWVQIAEQIEREIEAGNTVVLEGELVYSSFERDGVTIPTTTIRVTWIERVDTYLTDREWEAANV